MTDRTFLVLAGGDQPNFTAGPPPAEFVIAADSGLELAQALGVDVDLVIGDMDSVSPKSLEAAAAAGAEIERHPEEKDRTDLELALTAACRRGATRIIVIGGAGGRLDHLLANALLLAAPAWADLDIEWWTGDAYVRAVRRHTTFEGNPGDILTLLAVGEPAGGIVTKGLRYPLNDDWLLASSTRGVSNEFENAQASISLRSGVLLAIHQPLPGDVDS